MSRSGFVLIPKELYDSSLKNQSINDVNNVPQSKFPSTTGDSDGEAVEDERQYKKAKLTILANSRNKSKLIPFIPNPEPVRPESPPAREEAPSPPPPTPTDRILAGLPLEGVKLRRTRLLLDKFYKNPRLSLSTSDKVLIDGQDTNVNLGHFLNELQTKKKLSQSHRDIKRILEVQPHQSPTWVTVK